MNKKATHEYEIEETVQAGVVLTGAEVKSLRNKSGSLHGSHVQIVDGVPVLLNAQITPYKFADNREYNPKRTRALLLKKKEIIRLKTLQETQRRSLVPLRFELLGGRIKLIVGIGRGRKQYEKREKKKKQDLARAAQRELAL
ncbi:SsrA-binding protein SmpB [Candidatus Woesebacteria bacterium]|nr:SsrA-binding protein SmpB [Candidatus Woesebacteria bacterium]